MHNSDVKKYITLVGDVVATNTETLTFPEAGTNPVRFMFGSIVYTTTSLGMNRLIAARVVDEVGGILFTVYSRSQQDINEVFHYSFYSGADKTSAGNLPPGMDGVVEISLPTDLVILPGYSLIIFDSRNRDVNDSMVISGQAAVLR